MLKKFIKIKPITVVEIVLSYVSIGWAYVLFTSPTLFDTTASFSQIEVIAGSEWVVGVVALVCALTKILGMLFGNVRVRKIGLLMSTIFWIMIATSMLIATGSFIPNTGFIVYSGLAVMSMWTSKEVVKSGRL